MTSDPLQILLDNPQLLEYEQTVVTSQPFAIATWLHYLELTEDYPVLRDWVGRRAVQLLPKSYKLWKEHWEHAIRHEIDVASCFERALATLHPYPRVWEAYLEYLVQQPGTHPTHYRRTVQRALESVAVPQHDKIWSLVWKHLTLHPEVLPMESKLRLLKHSQRPQEWLKYLMDHEQWEQAVEFLLQQPDPQPDVLIALCSEHNLPQSEAILSSLQAWTPWAAWYVRKGDWDAARGVYQQGLAEVMTVQEFSVLYHAYLELEERLLEQAVEACQDDEEEAEIPSDDWDILEGKTSLGSVELALARAEYVTQRRPLWLNAVQLRQNPHQVNEWIQRASLMDTWEASAVALETALKTVEAPQAANGRPSAMVTKLLEIYEQHDVEKARELMSRICREHQYAFNRVEDWSDCWVAWIELELRQEQWDDALSLARQSVARDKTRKLQTTRSLKLWDLLLDLEESLGSVQTTKDAYNRALEIKVATVQHVCNFAVFLKEQQYFEEAFTAYERGIELFAFPHAGAKLLWKNYLTDFLDRYKGSKVERTRDLFERCLEGCPAEECSEFYLMNGKFEEDHGLTKRALSVYKEMCRRVSKAEKLDAYLLFVAKTVSHLGVTASREIYQDAIENLEDNAAATICIDFASMEAGLQQLDRARGIYSYGAQMADPRRLPEFWKAWNEFEIAHGNEETFREMLRVKRSVDSAFSTVNYNATGMAETSKTLTDEEAMNIIANEEGIDLDDEPKTSVAGFVPSKKRPASQITDLSDMQDRVTKLRKAAEADIGSDGNDDEIEDDAEIDIDDIDAEIEAAAQEGALNVEGVSTKAVPAAVFGGLTAAGMQ